MVTFVCREYKYPGLGGFGYLLMQRARSIIDTFNGSLQLSDPLPQ